MKVHPQLIYRIERVAAQKKQSLVPRRSDHDAAVFASFVELVIAKRIYFYVVDIQRIDCLHTLDTGLEPYAVYIGGGDALGDGADRQLFTALRLQYPTLKFPNLIIAVELCRLSDTRLYPTQTFFLSVPVSFVPPRGIHFIRSDLIFIGGRHPHNHWAMV